MSRYCRTPEQQVNPGWEAGHVCPCLYRAHHRSVTPQATHSTTKSMPLTGWRSRGCRPHQVGSPPDQGVPQCRQQVHLRIQRPIGSTVHEWSGTRTTNNGTRHSVAYPAFANKACSFDAQGSPASLRGPNTSSTLSSVTRATCRFVKFANTCSNRTTNSGKCSHRSATLAAAADSTNNSTTTAALSGAFRLCRKTQCQNTHI